MRKFDLTFVGNGILSVVSALKIKQKHPHLNVTIIGPFQRPFSASLAAGAMQAVFCEVEDTFHSLAREREIFNTGLEARTQWRELISEFKLQDVITAESTIMYRRKEGTLFEKSNFDAACQVATDYRCLEDVTEKELKTIFRGKLDGADVIAKKFIGEFSIDADLFFRKTQVILEKIGVTFIDTKVHEVRRIPGGVELSLENNETIQSGRAVLAAGSTSANLLPEDLPMVPLYHAVGTSMVLDSAPSDYSDLKLVVRTPNRGGAQCGMHIVPRNSGKFYLGAGNYLSDVEPAHRVETIRYLIDVCETELFGKQAIYSAKAELLLGSRPKSVDGYPIVGTWTEFPELFVATGTYRIGLTIAPVVAAEVCQWYETGKASDKFKSWSPDRELHSYAPMEVAIRYYSESRISNLIEHGLLSLDDKDAIAAKKVEMENLAKDLNDQVVKKQGFREGFVADPDMYAILASASPLRVGKGRS